MDKSRQGKSYLHGAVILAIAVAVVRILGALFRIPLGRILEDTGMSTFTVASHIYSVLLTLSSAGLPVALSKMISTSAALECPLQVKRVFAVGRNAFVFIGTLSFFVMAIFSQQLANMFGSPTAATAILVLSPAMLFVCLISAYRGYCQGFSIMMPTSVSQVIEASARFAIGLGLAWYLSSRGFSSEITVAGAISGVTVGAFIACVYLFFAKRRVENEIRFTRPSNKMDSSGVICKNLLNIAVPLTIGASIFSFINLVDTAIIMHRLRAVFEETYAGYENAVQLAYEHAQSLHGTYSMTMPLMNLPSSFVIPITIALIPAISALLAKGDTKSAQKTAESGIRITSLIALPAGVGLTVLAGPIMHVMYTDRFAAEGVGLMALMGLSAFFLCFFQVTNCILQAYGYQRYTVYTLSIGGLIKVILTWLLLSDPRISIYGAAISTVICYVFICVMNMVLVKWRIPDSPSFIKILSKPIICTLLMGFAAWASYGLLYRVATTVLSMTGTLSMALPLMGAIGIAMLVYLALVLLLGAITLEDMQMLPRGEKLAKTLRIRS